MAEVRKGPFKYGLTEYNMTSWLNPDGEVVDNGDWGVHMNAVPCKVMEDGEVVTKDSPIIDVSKDQTPTSSWGNSDGQDGQW